MGERVRDHPGAGSPAAAAEHHRGRRRPAPAVSTRRSSAAAAVAPQRRLGSLVVLRPGRLAIRRRRPGSPGADCGRTAAAWAGPDAGPAVLRRQRRCGSDPAPRGDRTRPPTAAAVGWRLLRRRGRAVSGRSHRVPGGDGGGGSGYSGGRRLSAGRTPGRRGHGNQARPGRQGAPPGRGGRAQQALPARDRLGRRTFRCWQWRQWPGCDRVGVRPRSKPAPRPVRHQPGRHHPSGITPSGITPAARHPAAPAVAPPVPAGRALPRSGFPFLQVGVGAAVLIGLGIVVSLGGRPTPPVVTRNRPGPRSRGIV